MKKSITIAFTCIGRRVELIRFFQSAYKRLALNGAIIGFDGDPLAPALQLVDKSYIVPPVHSEEYIPALVQICKTESIDVLFPLIDTDIYKLARNRELFERNGTKVSVVSPEAESITSDKWLTKQFFEKIGIPTPRTWLPENFSAAETGYPVFIKPRKGSAGKNVFLVRDSKDLAFFQTYVPDPIIQECLPGPEITSDVICDLNSKLMAVVSRKRLEVRWGEVSKGVTLYDKKILDDCCTIARELPAIGPITVQCMLKEGTPYFTEINARLGGGVPLGIAAGVDSPLMLLAGFADLPVEIPQLGTYKTSFYMTRYDDSFFFDEAEREKISSRRF